MEKANPHNFYINYKSHKIDSKDYYVECYDNSFFGDSYKLNFHDDYLNKSDSFGEEEYLESNDNDFLF